MAGKKVWMFNLCLFAVHLKLHFSLWSFTTTPTLMFAHVHLCNLNMWSSVFQKNWHCVVTYMCCASVSFLSPAMLYPSRKSNRNKTITRYKAIIQVWRPIRVKATLITRELLNIRPFLLTKLPILFCNLCPSPITHIIILNT